MKKMPPKEGPSCDWRSTEPAAKEKHEAAPKPRVHRHRDDFTWSGVSTERYKSEDGTWSEVLRRSLVGMKGEKTKFHLRYFEIAPGGHTTLETHRHEHVVVVVRGGGKCRIGKRTYDVGNLDTIYIPPNSEHQLMNPTREPFGFFCIVDAKRDRPRPVRTRSRQ